MIWPSGLLARTSNQQGPVALTTIDADGERSSYVAVPPLADNSTAGFGGGALVVVVGGAEVVVACGLVVVGAVVPAAKL